MSFLFEGDDEAIQPEEQKQQEQRGKHLINTTTTQSILMDKNSIHQMQAIRQMYEMTNDIASRCFESCFEASKKITKTILNQNEEHCVHTCTMNILKAKMILAKHIQEQSLDEFEE